jgi:hypothetical protein
MEGAGRWTGTGLEEEGEVDDPDAKQLVLVHVGVHSILAQ